jgi:hypothetical protein
MILQLMLVAISITHIMQDLPYAVGNAINGAWGSMLIALEIEQSQTPVDAASAVVVELLHMLLFGRRTRYEGQRCLH